MPDLSTLAEITLGQEQKSNERVDQYLTHVQDLLKSTPEWTPRHHEVFQEMIQEVRSNRRKAIASYGLFALCFLLVLLHFFWLQPRERQMLADRLASANLPIRFEQGDGGHATAYYSTAGLGAEAEDLLRRAGLLDQPIGHYPGIGREVPLEFTRDSLGSSAGLRWAISPQQRSDQNIGSLTINHSTGSLQIREAEIMSPIAHNDLAHLVVRVEGSSPAVWVNDQESRRGTSYELRYGLVMNAAEPVWSDQTVRIRYSPAGQSLDGPFLVSDPRWPMAFSVVAAAGYWGSDPAPARVYNLQSIARELRLN